MAVLHQIDVKVISGLDAAADQRVETALGWEDETRGEIGKKRLVPAGNLMISFGRYLRRSKRLFGGGLGWAPRVESNCLPFALSWYRHVQETLGPEAEDAEIAPARLARAA